MILTKLAESIGKGLFAGAFGTVAMTLSSTAEMKLRGRQGSTAPSDAAGKVLGEQPRDPVGKKRFSTAVHHGYGTAAAKNPYFTVSAYLAKALGVLRDKGEIATSRSPFSSTVTDSGTVTTASRWTSGYVVPGNGIPAIRAPGCSRRRSR